VAPATLQTEAESLCYEQGFTSKVLRTKKKQPIKSCVLLFCYLELRCLESNLRTKRGTEIIASAIVQEHDFIACLGSEAEPANVEFNAATGIENAVSVAVHDSADLVIDGARRDRPTYAKVDNAALEQRENPHRTGSLNFEASQTVKQPQIGADSACDYAGGDGLSFGALKVVGHLTFQNNVLPNVETQPGSHTQHIKVSRLQARKISKQAKASVVFSVTALGRSRRRE
jgi:hypothetical protein